MGRSRFEKMNVPGVAFFHSPFKNPSSSRCSPASNLYILSLSCVTFSGNRLVKYGTWSQLPFSTLNLLNSGFRSFRLLTVILILSVSWAINYYLGIKIR